MSYLALYRKYRPVDFDSVYGQEEVVTVIKNAINNNISENLRQRSRWTFAALYSGLGLCSERESV